MKYLSFFTAFVACAAIISATGCYNDNREELYPITSCDTANVTYAAVVKPIIDSKCATSGCHLGTAPSGYDLSSYAMVASVANNGKLVAAIEHTGPSPMPKGLPKLDDCTIAKIKIWVNAGAPNN